MSGTYRTCLTFVGDVTRDSRITRFISTLRKKGQVRVIALGAHDAVFEYEGATVRQFAHLKPDSLRKSLLAFWRTQKHIFAEINPNLVLSADLYSLPLAARISKNRRIPLIYDSRELYSSVAALASRKATQFFWSLLENWYISRVGLVLTVNQSIAEILRSRFASKKIHVAYNFPLRQQLVRSDLLREKFGISDDMKILLSQGGMQKGRGAFHAIRLLTKLSDCALVFLGSGELKEDLIRYVNELHVNDRVFFHPSIASNELLPLTASADLGLCLIENLGRSYYLSLPNKLFEYILAGVPVIASNFPELRKIVDGNAVGITVDPSQEVELYERTRELIDNTEQYDRFAQSCKIAAEQYVWEHQEEEFLNRIHELFPDVELR